MADTVARHIWYVQALRSNAEVRRGNVMYHVATATLAAVVVAGRLIAFAIRRAVVVDHNAILDLLAHIARYNVMHVLIQMIMVEAIIMKTVCIVGGNVRR